MAVDVHWPSIHEAWAANNIEFPIEFRPAHGAEAPPGADPREDLTDLADELNEEAAERWPDTNPYVEGGVDTFAGGAMALMDAAGEDGEVQTYLQELADGMTRRGWIGQLRGAPRVEVPEWSTSTDGAGRAIGIFLRFIPVPPRDGDRRHETLDETDAASLRDVADRWASLPSTQVVLWRSEFVEEAPRHGLGPILIHAVRRNGQAELRWVDTPSRSVRTIDVGYGPLAVLALASRTESWQARLDALTDVLRQLSPRLEVGLIDVAGPSIVSWSGLRAAPHLEATGVMTQIDRDLAREYLPDAYGLQVLTSRHLAKAHDLSAWMVIDLGNDRHLVQHPDPAAWFAHDHPDPDVLAAARRDFGDLILTPEAYAAIRGA
ncbi:hypothetical protein [Isoptericola sp. NPDC019482]|uniref:hypothetical protein n=1 Tax=Isoptericola sp. NPDC019482 TaxID=3154688 RepID=UPI00347E9FFE